MEQKLVIDVDNLGVLTIKAPCFSEFSNCRDQNVPIVSIPDDKTPIQYMEKTFNDFTNILLLEEVEYEVYFKFNDTKLDFSLDKDDFSFKIFPTNNNEFCGAFINFRSYVGKTFFNISEDGRVIKRIPIEIRSKKINYFDHYPAMIADLSKQFSSLIYESDSPLFQEFKQEDLEKTSFYEDFMFLEYLFRDENLPSVFEYLSNNLYYSLNNYVEEVPTSFASNIDLDSVVDVFSDTKNLYKSDDEYWINKTKGYVPSNINEIKQIDDLDNPENRFYKNFLQSVEFLINYLIDEADEGYVKDKLLYFNEEISYYLSQDYFKQISAMDYENLNSQVLQKKEGYRDILDYFLMMQLSFKFNFHEITNDFKGYEKKLSQLYEYWCYFELLSVLKEITNENIDVSKIFKVDKFQTTLIEGYNIPQKFKIDDGIFISLYYNKTFDKSQSYSVELRPDFTFEIEIYGNNYYLHFDAKYKVVNMNNDNKNSKNQDIYKMHTYKDAINNSVGAFVLYPGNVERIFWESDNKIEGVGAFPLTPGDSKTQYKHIISFIYDLIKKLVAS